MGDPTADFFAQLPQRAHAVVPAKATGAIRFDLACADSRVEHWLVAFDQGDVRVSSDDHDADLIVTTDKPLFDRLVVGEAQFGAYLRQGRLHVTGTGLHLYNIVRRVFPDAKGARDPRALVAAARRRRGNGE